MSRVHIMKMDLSLGNGSRYHESPCLDPIRNHTVCRPGKINYPLDLDNISAGTFNTCAHCHEAIGKIDHLRLARSIFKGSIPCASVAAIIKFSVPVTVTVSKTILAPCNRCFGVLALI